MSSAICLKLDQRKILSSGNGLRKIDERDLGALDKTVSIWTSLELCRLVMG